eukprot:Sspe_Gene.97919::Locus_71406_Transcript_1_1_Confidence_1.000_Length_2171::g.97919::m.97919
MWASWQAAIFPSFLARMRCDSAAVISPSRLISETSRSANSRLVKSSTSVCRYWYISHSSVKIGRGVTVSAPLKKSDSMDSSCSFRISHLRAESFCDADAASSPRQGLRKVMSGTDIDPRVAAALSDTSSPNFCRRAVRVAPSCCCTPRYPASNSDTALTSEVYLSAMAFGRSWTKEITCSMDSDRASSSESTFVRSSRLICLCWLVWYTLLTPPTRAERGVSSAAVLYAAETREAVLPDCCFELGDARGGDGASPCGGVDGAAQREWDPAASATGAVVGLPGLDRCPRAAVISSWDVLRVFRFLPVLMGGLSTSTPIIAEVWC